MSRWVAAACALLATMTLAGCAQRETHEALRLELLQMLQIDQEVRERMASALRDREPGAPASQSWIALVEEQNRIGEAHARRLDDIVNAHGWPGTSLVGDAASRAAMTILQHSMPERRKQYLPRLRAAAAQGDVEPALLAALETACACMMARSSFTVGTDPRRARGSPIERIVAQRGDIDAVGHDPGSAVDGARSTDEP